MADGGKTWEKIRAGIMYVVAVLLLLLVPLWFFLMNPGTIRKIGEKIPIREGTFDSRDGSFGAERPSR